MKKTKRTSTGVSMPLACAIGLMLSSLITIVLVLISAIFINNEHIEIGFIPYLAIVIEFISVLLGATVAGKNVTENKAVACVIVGGGYYLIQACCSMLFFDGISSGFWLNTLTVIIATGGAIYLDCKKKIRSGSKRKQIRHR